MLPMLILLVQFMGLLLQGQAALDMNTLVRVWSMVDDNSDGRGIFCNTPELRAKVNSYMDDCHRTDLQHCVDTLRALLPEVEQCYQDKEKNKQCSDTTLVLGVPGCSALLEKQWRLLQDIHAPCRDERSNAKIQQIVSECQRFGGSSLDPKYRLCKTELQEQLSSINKCWAVVNLDLNTVLTAREAERVQLSQKIMHYEDTMGYKVCVYKPKLYLAALEAFIKSCDSAPTEQKQYECRHDASYKFNKIDDEIKSTVTACQEYESFVSPYLTRPLNLLSEDIKPYLKNAPRLPDGRLDETACPSFYYIYAADAVLRSCWQENLHDPWVQRQVLEGLWGLMTSCRK